MATFNVNDKVVYDNIAGKHNGVGVITDLIGSTAKLYFDKNKPEANTPNSFYTYTDIRHLKHYNKEDM